MPLPFLTADRAFETADDVALPYNDRDRWRRPYRPGPWRVGAAAILLLLASFVLFSAVIIAATASLSSAGVVFGVALVAVVAALRLLRMGTWVSARGLRQVGPLTTRTTPWDQVVAVRILTGIADIRNHAAPFAIARPYTIAFLTPTSQH
ncbi:hypothetical protein ABZ657_31505, partial [Streptomyces sp. NPDC007000]